jgi:hypothetical protein
MRRHLALAAVVLIAACSSDAEPEAAPQPTRTTASPSPSPTPSYDPAWKTGFMTEPPAEPLGKRTYTFTSGGTSGERLRPGKWRTFGGPCEFEATGTGVGTGTAKGKTYEIDAAAGGWKDLPVNLDLPEGATLKVTHDGFLNGPGCIWGWDRALD